MAQNEPIIDIVAPDGTRYRAGKKYALGFDGARGEARELYNLTEYKLELVGWTNPKPYEWSGIVPN